MIRIMTQNEFNHVSITFDKNYEVMYSFARIYINSPFRGGFVIETPERILNGKRDVKIKIYKITISNEDYEMIKEKIELFEKLDKEMIYNSLNALLSVFKKRMYINNAYTCIEFLTFLLELTDVYTIKDLEKKYIDNEIYCGNLKLLGDENNKCLLLKKRNYLQIICDTIYHFTRILNRL